MSANELRTIVMGHLSWNTGAVDDIVFDKLDYVGDLTSLRRMASTHLEK